MPDYICECCNYKTHIKSHYNKHIMTSKHQNCIKAMEPMNHINNDDSNNEINIFKCEYCNKKYKYRQGLSKHKKYSCKQNKDLIMLQLNEQLNKKIQHLEKIIEEQNYELNNLKQTMKYKLTNIINSI